MIGALWYRHWLEIRGGALVALCGVVLLCLFFPVFLFGSSGWFNESGRVIKDLNAVAPALPALGAERFFPWGAHIWVCSAAAVIVGIFLAGTGIRTNNWQPGHLSAYYTLTLPVSRFHLIWTRFAASCAAVFALFAIMLLLNCATLLAMGRAIPVGPMAASSFLAGLLVMPLVAAFGLLALWDERLGIISIPAIVAGFQWGWTPVTGLIASQTIPWTAIGAIALIVGSALSVSALVAPRREF